jgi:hypothetical protein
MKLSHRADIRKLSETACYFIDIAKLIERLAHLLRI